jgi:hypothetical protein
MVADWNAPLRSARDLILTKDALCHLSYGSNIQFFGPNFDPHFDPYGDETR